MDRRIYPKVNIFLKILGRDDAGYHQLSSRFVLAHGALYDEMRLENSTHFSLSGEFGCEMGDNLIFKAAQILSGHLESLGGMQRAKAKAVRSLKVEVAKHIPKGAGLGGGSANAGVFLRAVNEMLELGLEEGALAELGGRIGSDVAFFASGVSSANVSGRGECVEAFDEVLAEGQKARKEARKEAGRGYELDSEKSLDVPSRGAEIEIFTPEIFCDTGAVYREYARGVGSGDFKADSRADFKLDSEPDSEVGFKKGYSTKPLLWLSQSSREIVAHSCHTELNDLYAPAARLCPQLKEIAQELGQGWCFSGSGSSFFRFKARI